MSDYDKLIKMKTSAHNIEQALLAVQGLAGQMLNTGSQAMQRSIGEQTDMIAGFMEKIQENLKVFSEDTVELIKDASVEPSVDIIKGYQRENGIEIQQEKSDGNEKENTI